VAARTHVVQILLLFAQIAVRAEYIELKILLGSLLGESPMTSKMSRNLVVAAFAAAFLLVSPTFAADPLSYAHRSSCAAGAQGFLADQPRDFIRNTVKANYADAREALSQSSVVGSSRPAFLWAMETNNSCGIALGYLGAGNYNVEAINECDCFHARMQSYR
jgi:hypothetical protein